MFWKKEIVYTDRLADYRKIKCWEFQKEFEALAETEKLTLEVQERLQKLEQLKKKTDKIKDVNFQKLWLNF